MDISIINKANYRWKPEEDIKESGKAYYNAQNLFLEHCSRSHVGFSIPYCWGPIVLLALEDIIIQEPSIRFMQIKEKWGGLIIYYNIGGAIYISETVNGMISEAARNIQKMTSERVKKMLSETGEEDNETAPS